MNSFPIASSLLLLSAALASCVDISIGSRHSTPPASPVVVSPPTLPGPADAATVAEIDAAARLDFETSRLKSLQQIAQRADLSSVVQVHLVNVGYRTLSFEQNKMALLRTVIANASFADATRQAIMSQLGALSFDANRQAILREVNERIAPR